jgi:Kef-type K+ transport system membrane component KefB
MSILYVAAQLGVVLFMFVTGLSFDTEMLNRYLRRSLVLAAVGTAIPLVVGAALGWYLSRGTAFFPDRVPAWQAAMFTGAATAATAVPVLARLLREKGLSDTRLGVVALAGASLTDLAVWLLLAAVLAAASNDPRISVIALAGTMVYIGLLLAFRSTLAQLSRRALSNDYARETATVAVMALLACCAWFTDQIGVYAVFGAFILGVAFPRGTLLDEMVRTIEPMARQLLTPLFFAYAGLQIRTDLLIKPPYLTAAAMVVLVAFASKAAATVLAWRLTGGGWREAASLAALTNARGLTELVTLTIALDHDLITTTTYTVFALMTLITTLAATPLYGLAQKPTYRRPASQPQPTTTAVGRQMEGAHDG